MMGYSSPFDDPDALPGTYLAAAPAALGAHPLRGAVETEVAIVGGGYTGLSTALHLAERTVPCVVLEAREVGSGGSGRAFGQVVPYTKHSERHVLAHYGPEVGRRILDETAGAPGYVFDLARRYQIPCNATESGMLIAANSAAGAAGLAARAQYWTSRGVEMRILAGRDVHRAVGSTHYSCALLEPRGGQINPLAYVRGLGLAAARSGVSLHEHSRATRIERGREGWRVHTEGGSVEARSVLIAGGAYLGDLWPGLQDSFVPMRAYQLVTEPLPEPLRASILPGGQSLTDTRRLYSGVRILWDGRMHLSVDGPAFDARGREFRAKATARVRRLFPAIGEVSWAEAWTGWVDMSGDQYPHVHALAPGLWAVTGLSGRGIALATLLGRDLAARLAGATDAETFIPVTPLQPIRGRSLAPPLIAGLMALYRVLDRVESAGYLRRSRNRALVH